ncbi:MAG: ATP-dependent sacrificial sulfur transferase LarE [Verrucomicrobiota bacterium]
MDLLRQKQEQLRQILRAHAPVLIAYSGGVDSAYLLAEAFHTLGALQMLGVIADSASLPRRALSEALALASRLGVPVEVVATSELENPDYNQNPLNRCYFCKAELFGRLERLAGERGFRALAYGENFDDLKQIRPGRLAASEFSVLAPLRDAGLTKAEIRILSREMDLPTADAPSQPCLSSRIPHGTAVTVGALSMVESGEEWVRSLGFSVFRVRHMVQGDQKFVAKVQIAPEEMSGIEAVQSDLVSGLRAVGYAEVEIDPAGYRST